MGRHKGRGFYVNVVEIVGDGVYRLACGHVQRLSRKPRARTICGTCHPKMRAQFVAQGGFRKGAR